LSKKVRLRFEELRYLLQFLWLITCNPIQCTLGFSEPSLKTVSMLHVLRYRLDTSTLPRILKQELAWMRMPNRITPLSSG